MKVLHCTNATQAHAPNTLWRKHLTVQRQQEVYVSKTFRQHVPGKSRNQHTHENYRSTTLAHLKALHLRGGTHSATTSPTATHTPPTHAHATAAATEPAPTEPSAAVSALAAAVLCTVAGEASAATPTAAVATAVGDGRSNLFLEGLRDSVVGDVKDFAEVFDARVG